MRRPALAVFCLSLSLTLATASLAGADRPLSLHFIDTEGGQATLIVTPSGQSLLIDAGWPGFGGRDADRIISAARRAGVQKIDYLLVTHYHLDHVGGVPQLASRFPVATLVDHGPNTETDPRAQELEKGYQELAGKGVRRLVVKPGDVLPIRDIRVEVVSARGERALKPLKGGGQRNVLCGLEEPKRNDPSENARSIGVLLTFGKFRFVDLGDLTWNKELELACPDHMIGPVDVYLTTHHGLDQSGPKAIVHGLKPRVAIMNNGARKGGSPAAWQIVSESPGLRDLWQLHRSVAGGSEHNVAEERISNLEEKCEGKGIEVQVKKSGEFNVSNLRSGFTKTYKP